MKTILVPTDFSQSAQWAIDVATNIARISKSRIILLHIVEPPAEGSLGEMHENVEQEDKLFSRKLIEKSKEQLQRVVRSLEVQGISVTSALRLGSPYHGMRAIMAEYNVDLVVMGTAGRSKFEGIFVGSNTEKVVRYSRCPVLTVHEEPATSTFDNIVYATGLNENEREFGRVVRELQKMFQARVHVVRINTPMNFQSDHRSKLVMREFVRKLGLENVTLNVYSDRSEDEGILNFAASIDADLIAMATHGRTGFLHVLVGSIAEDVVNHSRKPVLTCVVPESPL
jgi:nucleotide-binding universal stress UspA family protein